MPTLQGTGRGESGFGSTGTGTEEVRKTREGPKKLLKSPPTQRQSDAEQEGSGEFPQPKTFPVSATPKAAEEVGNDSWGSDAFQKMEGSTKGHRRWMQKLKAGHLEGILPDKAQYLCLANQTLEENPRGATAYKDECVRAAGLGEHFDETRSVSYTHLTLPTTPYV